MRAHVRPRRNLMSAKVRHSACFAVMLLLFALASPVFADERVFKPLEPIALGMDIKPLYDIQEITKDKPLYDFQVYSKNSPLYDLQTYSKNRPLYDLQAYSKNKSLYKVDMYFKKKPLADLTTETKPIYNVPSKVLS